ncbi:MAG: hypothetical protein CML67_14150 [Rhodobacteraceae bacterium]|nr:hypothetical protein [Paracoccaceae bacterium]
MMACAMALEAFFARSVAQALHGTSRSQDRPSIGRLITMKIDFSSGFGIRTLQTPCAPVP